MLNLIKKTTSIFGLSLAKLVKFMLDPHIPDVITHPFIPFSADLFVYLHQIGIEIR